MRRTNFALATLVLTTVFLFSIFNVPLVLAQTPGYSIQNVDYQVQIVSSGHLIVREVITLQGQPEGSFLLGFPYKYGRHILNGVAYYQNGILPINLGVQLGSRSGFYGAEITLPKVSSIVFTAIFVFSNGLLTAGTSGYSLDFPAYPSFAKDVGRCNTALILPSNALSVTISKADGGVNATTYTKENLLAFANNPAIVTFSATPGVLQQIDFASLNRVIATDPSGSISASDTFRITNKSPGIISTVHLDVPISAMNVVAKDETGRTLLINTTIENKLLGVAVTMQSFISSGQSDTITLVYTLPNAPLEQSHFTFNLDLFPVADYYVNDATVEIVLPEGAHFIAPDLTSLVSSVSVDRDLFQETLTVKKQGVSSVDRLIPVQNSIQVAYDYNILWLAFRPTFWVWGLFIAGSIVYMIWRRPKAGAPKKTAVPRLSAGLSPDNVRAFAEAYEERRRITHEMRVLHARVQKGKIPRNYYKSQRKTLEIRLTALSKNINQLKGTFRNAGGSYSDLVRQLDSSENEIEKARATVRSAETRHRTGEMQIEDYKKALAEYQRMKEQLDLQIDGILLRLREEIH